MKAEEFNKKYPVGTKVLIQYEAEISSEAFDAGSANGGVLCYVYGEKDPMPIGIIKGIDVIPPSPKIPIEAKEIETKPIGGTY